MQQLELIAAKKLLATDMKSNKANNQMRYKSAEKIISNELGDLYSNNEKHRCFSKEVAILMKKDVLYCTHIIRGKDIVCIRCYDILTRLQKPPKHESTFSNEKVNGCLTAKCGSIKSHYNLKRLGKCDCFKRYEPYRCTPQMKSYWTLLMVIKFSLKILMPRDIRIMLFNYIDRTEYIINNSHLHTVPYGDFPKAKTFLKKYHSACPNKKYDDAQIAMFISLTLDMKELWKDMYPRLSKRQRKAQNRALVEANRKPKRSHAERYAAYLESKK